MQWQTRKHIWLGTINFIRTLYRVNRVRFGKSLSKLQKQCTLVLRSHHTQICRGRATTEHQAAWVKVQWIQGRYRNNRCHHAHMLMGFMEMNKNSLQIHMISINSHKSTTSHKVHDKDKRRGIFRSHSLYRLIIKGMIGRSQPDQASQYSVQTIGHMDLRPSKQMIEQWVKIHSQPTTVATQVLHSD